MLSDGGETFAEDLDHSMQPALAQVRLVDVELQRHEGLEVAAVVDSVRSPFSHDEAQIQKVARRAVLNHPASQTGPSGDLADRIGMGTAADKKGSDAAIRKSLLLQTRRKPVDMATYDEWKGGDSVSTLLSLA